MLGEFVDVRQGKLVSVIVTELQIDIEPGARRMDAPPHTAGHKARDVEKTEVDVMLCLDFIESASTEWRFSVDYRRLNAASSASDGRVH